MQVSEDRSWAKGLSDLEYKHQYKQRYKKHDVIPSQKKYLKPSVKRDDPLFTSAYRDEFLKVKPKEEVKATKTYDCTCGEKFEKPWQKAQHTRKCEKWQKPAI